MKSAKIFIVFIFLLAFTVCVSAQGQALNIVWKNLQEKYESFNDINPTIINENNFPIYYDTYFYPNHIQLEILNEKSNSWIVSLPSLCGTGYKPSIKKAKSLEQIPFGFYKEHWSDITVQDSLGDYKFKKYPSYEGKGKYRFKFFFGVKKSSYDTFVSYSPIFEVIEKDFKK
jgi:hypothetical protein